MRSDKDIYNALRTDKISIMNRWQEVMSDLQKGIINQHQAAAIMLNMNKIDKEIIRFGFTDLLEIKPNIISIQESS